MTKAASLRICISLLVGVVMLASLSGARAEVDKKSILSQARQSYYNLRSEGLAAFQCNITPNWALLLQDQRKENPKGADAAIKILQQLHFTVSLAADDSVKLRHNDLLGQSQQMSDALKQIYGGMEQMTSGFFDTWKLFLVNRPFPQDGSKYKLEAIGPQYRLSYRENAADVVTTMSKDFAISNLKVTTAEFDSSIQPRFTSTPKGFVLNSYDASYKSQKPEETTQLKVMTAYRQVDGVQMLQKLNLSGTYGGSPFAVELVFSHCQVTKSKS
ncbi:MAG TPA: hypothetical protein VJX48_01250 [Xanthobacteraceae bacterium]|nr:hypothetical protein [Xanthobacteraceae bacterium]